MVTGLKKSGSAILESLTPERSDLVHMVMGAAGEVGELTDAIKKHVMYNKDLDRENVIEELGDIEFFLEGIRQVLGISREETLEHNMIKLTKGDKARYKGGVYTDKAAQDRADKK